MEVDAGGVAELEVCGVEYERVVVLEVSPLALGVVQSRFVVDTLRVHPADVEQGVLRFLEAHLPHARVELEARVLNGAILEVDDASFVTHDVAVGATHDYDLRSVAHLTPGEGRKFRCSVERHGLPAVVSDGITFDCGGD